MNNIKTLTIGDKVSLCRVTERDKYSMNRGENDVKFPSKLVDIVSDEILVVTVPYVNNNYIEMLKNQEYKISIYTKTTILQSQVLVMHVYKENNIRLVSLHLQNKLYQFQRRRFYRMPCTIKMNYREVSPLESLLVKRIEDENTDSCEMECSGVSKTIREEVNRSILEICKETLRSIQKFRYTGVISDLSGGGIRFHSEEKHNLYDKFRIRFTMSKESTEEKLELDVCIIDAKKLRNTSPQYEYRANFVSISEKDRENIIRGIFKIECKNRRRK